MKETRYFYVPHAERSNELPAEEAAHASRVLRLESGDEVFPSVSQIPSEVFRHCRGEFFEGHGPGEAGEAVGPCDEFFGGQRGHGVLYVLLGLSFPAHGPGGINIRWGLRRGCWFGRFR